MPLSTAAQEQSKHRLPKVIDAHAHGVIDYCHAAFFLAMGLLCRRKNPRAATAALFTGAFVLAESLLTDYPLGVKAVIPFGVHGRLDTGFAASSPMMPRLFGFEGTTAAKVFKTNGLIEATLVGLTDFNSQRAREEKIKNRTGATREVLQPAI